MLLVIDIGNTNITYGIFKGNELIFDWRISTDRNKTSDEYGMIFRQILETAKIKRSQLEAVVMASVVPDLMSTFSRACRRYLDQEPLVVDEKVRLNISNKYHRPNEVGADRLVNAVAGVDQYGGPLIIVDIGTAITFDYVNAQKEYLGGAIVPGIGISLEALFTRTAKLPKIELEKPESVIGRTTEDSIQAGVVYGYIGLIDAVIEKILEEEGLAKDQVKIIGTGGYSVLIAKNSKYIEVIDKMITLEGLQLIYEMNRDSHEARP